MALLFSPISSLAHTVVLALTKSEATSVSDDGKNIFFCNFNSNCLLFSFSFSLFFFFSAFFSFIPVVVVIAFVAATDRRSVIGSSQAFSFRQDGSMIALAACEPTTSRLLLLLLLVIIIIFTISH